MQKMEYDRQRKEKTYEGGDVGGIVQSDHSLEILGKVRAPGGQALGVSHILQRVGVSHVIYEGETIAGEGLAVGRDSTDAQT